MNRIKAFLLFGLIPLFAAKTFAAGAQPSTGTEAASPYALNIKHPASYYDSLAASWNAFNTQVSFDKFAIDYIELDSSFIPAISSVPDAHYQERLKAICSPVQLPYNKIIKDRLVAYTTTHKSLVLRMLAYSQYYFPIFEAELARQGLPLELKFLPVIESALIPTATSRVGAVGLWQIMLNTGRQYGLEISSMIDERRDPVAATRAACLFLKDLYRIYEDWTLVLAAYNYGPGNVNKAIRSAGVSARTYWDIYPYLPKATRDYVPAFVAVTYAYHYYKEHDLRPSSPPLPLATDTVTIRRMLHLEQVSSTLGIPIEVLEVLNPQYKQRIIPAVAKTYPLVLPQQDVCCFLDNQEAIHAKDSTYLSSYLKIEATPNGNKTVYLTGGSTYKVKSGDTLGGIAKKNGVTVKQLMQWNNLSSANKLSIGQNLQINK